MHQVHLLAGSEVRAPDAVVVLETVTEDPELKRDLFVLLGTAAPDEALLASNTSGIPITDIARGARDCADRIVGCHWWYPPYLLRPVEVVRGAETSDETMDIAGLALFETVAAGVFPHLCDEDEPNALFEEYLQRGQGGVVDGDGFFEYDDSITEVAYRRDSRLAAVESALSRADREC